MRVAIQTSIDEWDCYIPENPVKSLVKLPENPARERRLEAGEYEKLMEVYNLLQNSGLLKKGGRVK